MSEAYQELLEGAVVTRRAPGARHELICSRLHQAVLAGVANFAGTRLLAPRSEIRLTPETRVRPDLSLVAVSTGKLWLAAEVISSDDHRADTVVKKELYEQIRLPRLWMIDPRYDNVEIYHGSPYGLMLKAMLAGRDTLAEQLLPEFQMSIAELFESPPLNS